MNEAQSMAMGAGVPTRRTMTSGAINPRSANAFDTMSEQLRDMIMRANNQAERLNNIADTAVGNNPNVSKPREVHHDSVTGLIAQLNDAMVEVGLAVNRLEG